MNPREMVGIGPRMLWDDRALPEAAGAGTELDPPVRAARGG